MCKVLLAAIAILLTVAMYVPYIRSIRARRTRPQLVSWVTWTVSAFVGFFAQLAGHGGSGAWPIGASAVVSAYIAMLAYRHRSESPTTRADWLFLVVALVALPFWLVTSDPLVAVVLLTSVELAGFVPTFRFVAKHPYEERICFYSLGALRNCLAAVALEQYSLTTVLFPAAKGVVCVLLVGVIGYRRTQIRLQEASW